MDVQCNKPQQFAYNIYTYIPCCCCIPIQLWAAQPLPPAPPPPHDAPLRRPLLAERRELHAKLALERPP